MKDKTKVALAFFIVLAAIAVTVVYSGRFGPEPITGRFGPEPINPPDILETEVIIDLKSPTEGTISSSSDSTASKVLSQYYIPYEDSRDNAASYNFFASDKSEFSGPAYVFRQEPLNLFYEEVDITIIFPEGYDILYQNRVGTFKQGETYTPQKPFVPSKQPVFEDGRWHYFISNDELNEFDATLKTGYRSSIEIVYIKAGE